MPAFGEIAYFLVLQFAGHGFDQAIKKETSGDLQKSYMTIYAVAIDVHGYYAEKIEGSMKGMGTKEAALIQNVVSRVEVCSYVHTFPFVVRKYQYLFNYNLTNPLFSYLNRSS